jgi:uncharacterized OsmC-like protein
VRLWHALHECSFDFWELVVGAELKQVRRQHAEQALSAGVSVDRHELRERQKPLKDHYRGDPQAALITLHAQGLLVDDDVSCSVQTGRALVEAGLHPATGGTGTLACSGDMLLQALVACAGVTLRSVATNRGLEVSGTVRAEGDLDFRGTLGVDPEAPVGFRSIRLSFELTSNATREDLDALIATTERYCVVLQTLALGPDISVTSTTATR